MTESRPATAPILGQALPVELMNTIWADRGGGHDSLASAGEARRWLRTLRASRERPVFDGADVPAGDGLARLRGLRDALRRIAADRTGDRRERAASGVGSLAAAVRTVNAAARTVRVWPVLELTGGVLAKGSLASGARDDLLAGAAAREAIGFFSEPGDLDLRACLAPGCVLYFVKDHPRREWCSTACGNRARAARHYARHGAGPPGRQVTRAGSAE